MSGAVDDRPERAGCLNVNRIATKKPRADAEQDSSAQLQSISLLFTPGKRLQKGQPRVFEPAQFLTFYTAMQQVCRNGLQSRLSWDNLLLVQLVQPFAPPGEPDRPEVRVG